MTEQNSTFLERQKARTMVQVIYFYSLPPIFPGFTVPKLITMISWILPQMQWALICWQKTNSAGFVGTPQKHPKKKKTHGSACVCAQRPYLN